MDIGDLSYLLWMVYIVDVGWQPPSRIVGRDDLPFLLFESFSCKVPVTKKTVRTTSGYGSIPINTIFSGMNIHLPAILMFTRGTRFFPLPSESKRQVFQSSMWDMSTNENSTNPQHSAVPRQRSSSPRLADDFAGEPWLTVHRHRPIRWFTVTDQVICQNLCSKKIWIWLAEHPWPDISIFMIWIGVNLWTTQVSPRLPRSRIFTNWLLHLRLFLLHLWLVKLHHTGWQLVCNPQQQ